MPSILRIIKKHPFSFIGFELYLSLCFLQLRTVYRYKAATEHMNHGDHLAWGEGVMYGYYFVILIAFVCIIAVLIRAAFRKEESKFYTYLGLGIVGMVITVLAV